MKNELPRPTPKAVVISRIITSEEAERAWVEAYAECSKKWKKQEMEADMSDRSQRIHEIVYYGIPVKKIPHS